MLGYRRQEGPFYRAEWSPETGGCTFHPAEEAVLFGDWRNRDKLGYGSWDKQLIGPSPTRVKHATIRSFGMWCKCGWTRKLAFNSTIVVLVGKHYAKAKIGLQFRNWAMHPVRTCLGCYEQATQGDRTPKAETTTWPTDVRLIPKFLLNNDLGITGRNRLQCEAHGGPESEQENIPFWLFKLCLNFDPRYYLPLLQDQSLDDPIFGCFSSISCFFYCDSDFRLITVQFSIPNKYLSLRFGHINCRIVTNCQYFRHFLAKDSLIKSVLMKL